MAWLRAPFGSRPRRIYYLLQRYFSAITPAVAPSRIIYCIYRCLCSGTACELCVVIVNIIFVFATVCDNAQSRYLRPVSCPHPFGRIVSSFSSSLAHSLARARPRAFSFLLLGEKREMGASLSLSSRGLIGRNFGKIRPVDGRG